MDMDTPTKNIVNVSGDCFDYVKVFSYGMWNVKPGESILQHSLVRFHVQLLVMFIVSASFQFLLKRFHLSRLTSDLLAGIVLGPTFFGKYFVSASNYLFPTAGNPLIITSLSKAGYVFFVFLAGVRMDITYIWKAGRTSLYLGLILVTTASAMIQSLDFKFVDDARLAQLTKIGFRNSSNIYFGVFVHTQFVAVSFILMQHKLTNSQLGRLALSSALITELVRVSTGTLRGFGNAATSISRRAGLQTVIFSLAFLTIILTILRQVMFAFIRRTPKGQPMKEIYASVTVALLFLVASCGDSVGLNYTLGPLIFGFVVPARSPLAEILTAKFDPVVSGFLLPLLTIFCASKFNLWEFTREFQTLLTFKISLIGYIIKMVITFIGVLCCKIPLRHTAALTIILNAKGVYEVGVLFSFTELKGIQASSGVFLVLLLQMFQPIVKMLYHPTEHYISYKKRSIEQASDEAELPILACAHRQEDAVAAIQLLGYSNPTIRSPLSIFGLCLEELVSSFTPLLIDHQLGQKISSSDVARSQPIIDVFMYFKSQHKKSADVQVFTAISPLQQMNEDICWLSFDKGCSIIILPFHKKWNSRGKMVSNNFDIRTLNIKVLESAPCSVGTLIDRSRTRGLSSIFVTSTTYRVAALFVGGPDDREALSYALRMGRSQRVHLTVLRFTTGDDHANCWESMLDNELLRNMRTEMSSTTNIEYIQEKVRDGSDTATTIRSMVGDHDLIMVGRCHVTEHQVLSGLSEWTELPELGPIGDLLASDDISSPVSVLVVQQQIRTMGP